MDVRLIQTILHSVIGLCVGFSTVLFPANAVGQALADPVDHRIIAFENQDFCEHAPWTLVFEDEFEGQYLDTLKWLRFYPYCVAWDSCMESRTHGYPHELQIFRDENVQLSGNGTVKLVLQKGPQANWHSFSSVYSSGLLHSRERFGRGRFECRCRIPKSSSHFITSAFWLFGSGEYCCSEIDIMEQLWKSPDDYHHSLHRYKRYGPGNHASDEAGHPMPRLSEDFHTYRVDWDRWFADFYVDGALIYRSCRIWDLLTRPVSSCEPPAGIYMQNQAFPGQDDELSIILGLGLYGDPFVTALGGGPPIPDLPAVMEIDYVRVHQRMP